MKKTFTTLNANIDELGYDEYSLISYNSKDRSGNSHLQFHNKPKTFTEPKNFNTDPEDSVNKPGVTTPTGVVLQQAFEERNRKVLFKKSHVKSINIELSNVILLDIQSTMDLFCNPNMVGNIYKAEKRCAFRLTEARFSSLTRQRYLVTSHMSGSTKNLSSTSFPSGILLRSITPPTIA